MKLQGKQTRQLPARTTLNALGKPGTTIADYAKASPITQQVPSPPAILAALQRKP